MQYHMSQAELIHAVEFYLNKQVLQRPIKVESVKPQKGTEHGINYALHVTVSDDQEHLAEEHKSAAARQQAV